MFSRGRLGFSQPFHRHGKRILFPFSKNPGTGQSGPGWELFLVGHQQRLAAHVGAQHFGDGHSAIGLQVVLQESDQHTRRGHTGIVQGMTVLVLFAGLASVVIFVIALKYSTVPFMDITLGEFCVFILLVLSLADR